MREGEAMNCNSPPPESYRIEKEKRKKRREKDEKKTIQESVPILFVTGAYIANKPNHPGGFSAVHRGDDRKRKEIQTK